jgi:hypothetical protein
MLPPADTHIKMQIVRRKVTWHVCGGGNNPNQGEFSKWRRQTEGEMFDK